MTDRIVFLGSPLIDITAEVDRTFLDRHGLKIDDITGVESNKTIFQEIIALNPKISIGGSITNTVRIFNQLHDDNNVRLSYLGSVGKDEYGRMFKEELEREGINFVAKEIYNVPTGRVAVLIADRRFRCLVTDLGASQIFEVNHDGDVFAHAIETAAAIYFSGLFLKVNVQLIHQLIANRNLAIFFNLGAQFVMNKYSEDVLNICSHASVVFGNESEYEALMNISTQTTGNLKKDLLNWLPTIDSKMNTIYVMTRAQKPVYVFEAHARQIWQYSFKAVGQDEIVDTNGAGDAFVGGFLAQFLRNKSIDLSVACGLHAAQEVVKHVGCGFDKDLKFHSELSTQILCREGLD